MRWIVAVLTTLVLGAGCGSGQADAVRTAAADFADAVGSGDWAAACELLAPETRSELEQSTGKGCDEALPEEQPPSLGSPETVVVFGTMAELRYAEDTLFLTRFQDGWRVLAAVCTPRDAKPYDCRVKGA